MFTEYLLTQVSPQTDTLSGFCLALAVPLPEVGAHLMTDVPLFRERPSMLKKILSISLTRVPAAGLYPLQTPSPHSSRTPASGCLPELTRHLLPSCYASPPLQSEKRHRL